MIFDNPGGWIAMIRLIEDHRETIGRICAQYRVQRLELFGSGVSQDNFDENSDLDFLVEFKPLVRGEHADTYFGLLEALEDLLGRHIDLVMLSAVKNRYFLESINQNRKVVYAA